MTASAFEKCGQCGSTEFEVADQAGHSWRMTCAHCGDEMSILVCPVDEFANMTARRFRVRVSFTGSAISTNELASLRRIFPSAAQSSLTVLLGKLRVGEYFDAGVFSEYESDRIRQMVACIDSRLKIHFEEE